MSTTFPYQRPRWVNFDLDKPKQTGLYTAKNNKGQLLKAHFSKSEGGMWDYVMPDESVDSDSPVVYWLKHFPKSWTINMSLGHLRESLVEYGLFTESK